LPTDLVQTISGVAGQTLLDKLTRREYALIVCVACASILAILPIALYWFGTRWRPGVKLPRAIVERAAILRKTVNTGNNGTVSSHP
jgi:hypothetical protein